MIRDCIKKLVAGTDLSYRDSQQVMREIISGKATHAQIGAFLTALSMKGEKIQEITAFATIMREFCIRIYPRIRGRLVDTCGTGGDMIKTFNVSTASAFVIAGMGISVAKHGNRSVTSKCGSADVLEALGININMEPQIVEKSIEQIGIGFMFAPKFHPAMSYTIGPRREIGIRSVFNIMGPLTNPAGANAQLVGVYNAEWLMSIAHVLRELGCEEAMIVHGLDGLDEISILGKTSVVWLKDSEISVFGITPQDFGFKTADSKELVCCTQEENAEVLFRLLNDSLEPEDPKRNMVLLNSAAGSIVGHRADNITEGIEISKESLKGGYALKKLEALIKESGGTTAKLERLKQEYD